MVFVPAPDAAARACILELKLRDRPRAPKLDVGELARRTEGFSGADLQALVDAATERAFECTADSGVEQCIDDRLLGEALRDLKPSTRPWLETARNYAIYANDGGSYDELLAYLKTQRLA
jgi:SpoVK/Ycf46/Vps4 family AAA+-type ATPase